MAAEIATGANAQNLPPIRRGTSKNSVLADPPRSMDDIAEGACKVLNHIENNGTEDRYVTGYIRARDWQRDLVKAVAPNTQSNSTSSPGVLEIELREGCEIIVKVGPNREAIRGLMPKDLVERAERQRATNAQQKNSEVLAKHASFVTAGNCHQAIW